MKTTIHNFTLSGLLFTSTLLIIFDIIAESLFFSHALYPLPTSQAGRASLHEISLKRRRNHGRWHPAHQIH
jgi:hypothetical protein